MERRQRFAVHLVGEQDVGTQGLLERDRAAELGHLTLFLGLVEPCEGDVAARRVDDYFARMVQEQAPFVPVPTPVSNVLRKKYKYSFNDAGLDRAVQEASKIRSSADSARSAGQPQTAVPLNPAMPSGTPPAATSTPSGKK